MDIFKVSFVWESELLRLISMVEEAKDRKERTKAIRKWFLETIFQLEQQYVFFPEVLSAIEDKDRFRYFAMQRIAHKMSEELLENNFLYREVQSEGGSFERWNFSLLVLGTPQFIKNNKTGRLEYVRRRSL